MSIEVSNFAEIQTEFMRRVIQAVYCSMATVDRKGRPRSRILHPVWDGATGWVITWTQSHKTKHLQVNSYVSLAYIYDRDKPVYADCRAEWVNTEEEKLRIWELHKSLPPPLGFDPNHTTARSRINITVCSSSRPGASNWGIWEAKR